MEKSLINPYDFLGVTIKSSIKELKKKYFELALICHPDKGGNSNDMDILNKAYLYILEQINNCNNNITFENLEENFEIFCKNQLNIECPYSKIYNDFRDTFNKDFDKKKKNEDNDPFSKGYGSQMLTSSFSDNSNYNDILTETLKNEEKIILPKSSIIKYESPDPINENYSHRYLDYKKINDFSTKNESDYIKAFTFEVYNESNYEIQYKTLEELEKEREIFDIYLKKSLKN